MAYTVRYHAIGNAAVVLYLAADDACWSAGVYCGAVYFYNMYTYIFINVPTGEDSTADRTLSTLYCIGKLQPAEIFILLLITVML